MTRDFQTSSIRTTCKQHTCGECREPIQPGEKYKLWSGKGHGVMNLGIGQDFPRAPACVSIQLGAAYGRERDCVGFWIESDEIAPTDADSPSPCHRIGLALIRLAYAVALVSMTRSKP